MHRSLTNLPSLKKPSCLRFGIGEGNIDPELRLQTGEINEKSITSVAEALMGSEYDVVVQSWPVVCTPTMCVDGRCGGTGFSAAGGTFSLVIGDALSMSSYCGANETAPEHARTIFTELIKMGQPIGGHNATNAVGINCGCLAEDCLDSRVPNTPSILRYIAERGDNVRMFLESIGISTENKLHSMIMQRAQQLIKRRYATTGNDICKTYIDVGSASSIVTLNGAHNEIFLRINTRPGLTLNREMLAHDFGLSYQSFNLDIPSLMQSCFLLSMNTNEAHEKFIAALYYNAATAAVIAGPGLRIIVR